MNNNGSIYLAHYKTNATVNNTITKMNMNLFESESDGAECTATVNY